MLFFTKISYNDLYRINSIIYSLGIFGIEIYNSFRSECIENYFVTLQNSSH